MNNIIILGGTFNPVHNGHIELAKRAHELLDLPVLVMPSGDPSSYKSKMEIVSADHRIHMLEIALKPYDYMKISRLEVDRQGRTYTADTLRLIGNQFDEIYFIIGADSFFAIHLWYMPEYVCEHCVLLVAGRDNHSEQEMIERKIFLEKKYHASIVFLHTPNMPFSSTEIREGVAKHQSVDKQLPDGVSEYILENHLYQSTKLDI